MMPSKQPPGASTISGTLLASFISSNAGNQSIAPIPNTIHLPVGRGIPTPHMGDSIRKERRRQQVPPTPAQEPMAGIPPSSANKLATGKSSATAAIGNPETGLLALHPFQNICTF
jgi:hypothetical protein